MYGKMQESGLPEIIPFIGISGFLTVGSGCSLMAAALQVFFLSAFRAHQLIFNQFSSVQFSGSVVSNSATPWTAACQLPEFTQTHVHWVCHAIQPSHPLSSPSPPTFSMRGLHSYHWWLWHPCLLLWQEIIHLSVISDLFAVGLTLCNFGIWFDSLKE